MLLFPSQLKFQQLHDIPVGYFCYLPKGRQSFQSQKIWKGSENSTNSSQLNQMHFFFFFLLFIGRKIYIYVTGQFQNICGYWYVHLKWLFIFAALLQNICEKPVGSLTGYLASVSQLPHLKKINFIGCFCVLSGSLSFKIQPHTHTHTLPLSLIRIMQKCIQL